MVLSKTVNAPRPGSLAYLVSQYPAINHGFMLREVRELRRLGWQIASFSVALPDRDDAQLSAEERAERELTRYLKGAGAEAVRATLAYALTQPGRFLNAVGYALGLGRRQLPLMARRLLYLVEAVLLGQWVKAAGKRHVHTHYSSTVTLLMKKLYPELTFSLTVHGPDEVEDPAGFSLREKLRNASLVMAISHYAKSQMMRFSEPGEWDRIVVGYLGTPPVDAPERPERPAGEPVRFLCVGRLAPVKGQHVLIEAAAALKRQGARFRVSIAGGGPSATALAEAVRKLDVGDCVTLEGRVSDARLTELYREADVFVLPSFAEGVPGVLMEAMITGLPCISTGVNGVPELITAGEEGLLVPPADVEGLARAMAALSDDAALRRRLGAAGRQKVLTQFNLETNVARLAAVFHERLNGRV